MSLYCGQCDSVCVDVFSSYFTWGWGGASPKALAPFREADPLHHASPNMSHGTKTNLNPAIVAQWLSIDL